MENKISRRVAEIAGKERISGHEFFDAKRIYLNDRAAALLSSKDSFESGFDDAMQMASRIREGEQPHGHRTTPQAIQPPAPAPEAEPAFVPALEAVADRLAGAKRRAGGN